jgi:hypothetical protein
MIKQKVAVNVNQNFFKEATITNVAFLSSFLVKHSLPALLGLLYQFPYQSHCKDPVSMSGQKALSSELKFLQVFVRRTGFVLQV